MISLIDINKTYSTGFVKTYILRGINLEIKEGESVLITGINGIGKTTLLRLMAGVLLPQGGRITFSDKLGPDPRSRIGFISDKMNVYENMSLDQAIRFHSRVYGIDGFDKELIRQAKLKTHQKISKLSRGQKLVFHLSLLLAARPQLLLIDEIIHSMDVYLRDIFLNRLLEMIEQNRITLVLVNLNFHDIEKIPQRILLLKDNQIALDEPMDSLKTRIKKVFSDREIPNLPVLFHKQHEDGHEYYIYPFERDQISGASVQVTDLNLHEIIKALIGGEYAE